MFGRLTRINWRLVPIQAGILATLALVPLWHRLPYTPLAFTPLYVTRFLILLPMLWTITWWLILGLPGWAALRRDGRRHWAWALLLLVLWAFASTTWAFIKDLHPEVAQSAALQLAIALLFALVVACTPLPTRAASSVLTAGVFWNSILAFLQVAHQAPLGLEALGEFPIRPDEPGISVLMAGSIRWLRPYGLLAHPNLLGGFFVVGLLATLAWVCSARLRDWVAGSIVFLGGLWGLLLTFSRAAWGGLAVGALAILPLYLSTQLRRPAIRRRVMVTALLAAVVSLLFAALYWPLLEARAGVNEERVEMRSIADRLVFLQFAERTILENPIIGVGIGNFPWRTSYYLLETDFDLRGDNVHNVYLLAWSELGIIGLGLLLAAMLSGSIQVWQRFRQGRLHSAQIALFGAFIALAAIGLLDHYPWTLIQFQTAWWGSLALCLKEPPAPA